MRSLRSVKIDGTLRQVLISDESQALLAATAAGRAVVGYAPNGEFIAGADYVVESLEELDEAFLEQVVRRSLGLPWRICETDRLLIREFSQEDLPKLALLWGENGEERREKLEAYIRCQYGFFEYGLWALIRREDGEIVGWAGFSLIEEGKREAGEPMELEGLAELEGRLGPEGLMDLEGLPELGYYILKPFRRQGYAKEACRAILEYGREQLGFTRVICRIERSNQASLKTAAALGAGVTVVLV